MSAVLVGSAPTFRPLSVADLDAIMEIEQRAYPFPWSQGIFRDCLRVGYCCWCYEIDDEIHAYGVMSVAAGESHILNLTVCPESQRQGFGIKLMQHFLRLARRHNADIVMLEVRPSNIAAIRLYEKLGFNEAGVRPNYYPAGEGREDALLLALNLM
ncbi:Ribosomal-protein-S18p-alanine acetyltransferase [hydrothermal vent metagenome]|uniref:Ribosomal-protein-S18p-alanine acetyltransferase n=1 Tax=hydrothermal vent metagenome TaxID=652676 RepID=A0A3B0Z6P0_9ZZZZ